jgi:hypothetical protein
VALLLFAWAPCHLASSSEEALLSRWVPQPDKGSAYRGLSGSRQIGAPTSWYASRAMPFLSIWPTESEVSRTSATWQCQRGEISLDAADISPPPDSWSRTPTAVDPTTS